MTLKPNKTLASISRIKLFKACRRAYELRYQYGLYPIELADSLTIGLGYHEYIEEMYSNPSPLVVDMGQELTKEHAMAEAYRKYILPKLPRVDSEVWVEDKDLNLIGRVDGIAFDGRLVEHKTSSSDIGDGYEYGLMWDEQILAYMMMTNITEMWYTVCRRPTIRQKKTESDEEFYQRMIEWYDEDTEQKIRIFLVTRTVEEIEQFREDMRQVLQEMNNCKSFYRNTAHCFKWGRQCEYAPICLQNIDNNSEYVGFRRDI